MHKNTRVLPQFLLSALLAVEAGTAMAEAPSERNRATEGISVARASANYAGVTPGQNSRNPLPPAPGGSPRLIWTGFQSTPSGSRVFLQTTSPTSYEIKETLASKSDHATLVVVLRNCRIHMANNQRRMDTRAFPTPVQGFIAKQKRGDVELRITLRERVTATPTTEVGSDGTQLVLLDFPPGRAEIVESPARAEAVSGGVLRLPADEDPQLGRRMAGKAATEPRPSSIRSGSTSSPAASQPTGQEPPVVNSWNPSGLGPDETPGRAISR